MIVKKLVCKYCGVILKSRSGLYDHERRHVGIGPYKCCGKTYFSRANLSRHRCSVHGKEKNIKCSKCTYTCATKSDLNQHDKIHQEPKFKCEICGVKHVTRTALRCHMDVHQDEKRHRCICGRTFRFSSDLELISGQIVGEGMSPVRVHICDICGKPFPSKWELGRHRRTHTGEKPYTCEYCNKAFSDKSNMNQHIKGVHFRQPFRKDK